MAVKASPARGESASSGPVGGLRTAPAPVGGPRRAPAPAGGASVADPSGGRVEGLDGVRALAVIAVLVYHLRPASLPGGFLGVDIFFVVSGFLITTLLLRELSGRGRLDLAQFWVRRARRLVPALVVVVAVSIPLAWAVSSDLLVGIGRQTLGALTFSSNWLEVAAGSSYFSRTSPQLFVNFWSLAVEEQFYLLWPLVLAALVALTRTSRHRVRVVLALAGSSALGMALLLTPGGDATRVYYGTDTHLFGLMIGAALAFTWASPGQGVLGSPWWGRWRTRLTAGALTGLVLLMLTLREDLTATFRGGLLLASVLAAVLVAALLGRPGAFRHAMQVPALEWVGQRSYGIYLWHWPIICLLSAQFPTAHDSPGHGLVRASALALTLLVAAASFRWLEQPVRRHGFRGALRRVMTALTGPRPRKAQAAVAVTAAMVVLSALAVTQAPEKSATQLRIEAAREHVAPAGAGGAGGAPDQSLPADFSPPTGEELTVFGDSIVVTSTDGLVAALPGVMLDAESNRRWTDGEAAVQARLAEGSVRRAVVLDFGTNAGVDPDVVRRVLQALGPHRMIAVVNLYGGSYWVPEANQTLAAVVEEFPNAMIADWHGAISAHPAMLQSDQIHPDLDGAHLYAQVIVETFEQLSRRLTDGTEREPLVR